MTHAVAPGVRAHVTAVVVSHNGERWLPRLIDALARATRAPDRVLAVDTGSRDGSAALLRAAFGDDSVGAVRAGAGFGAAVRAALDGAARRAGGKHPVGVGAAAGPRPDPHSPDEWLWLLHDDCCPAPQALDELLAVGTADPAVAVVGCRVRAWPRGRRLLEVGVSIGGTGRRETGLEPGEYDQGQHDEVRDVLGVSSAGMLVRRHVWESLGGFDRRLPFFRDDVDFGWRAVRAGHRVVVAPAAVLFHVEASARGVRDGSRAAAHPHRADRAAALFTLLANVSRGFVVYQYVRLLLGSLLRTLGYLLGKLPGAAYDEVLATASVLGRPWRIVAARTRRRRTATAPRATVRRLLPPWWSPYAAGLEAVLERFSESARGAAGAVATSARRLRGARPEAAEGGLAPEDVVPMPAGEGPWAWPGRHPLATLTALLTVLALVATRGLWGSGLLQGGGLPPSPDSAGAWWRLMGESWHQVGLGSTQLASPYVVALAVPATVLGGKAWLVVDLLMLLAVPLAGLGAWACSRRLVEGRATRLWMTATFALLPAVMGTATAGRVGTVAASVLLPWVALAATSLLDRGRSGWRSAWATALLLAAASAFAPVLWPMAVVLAAIAVPWLLASRGFGGAALVLRLAVALAAVPLLLLPWSLRFLHHPSLVLTEAGLIDPHTAAVGSSAWQLPLGRLGAPGAAPWWLTCAILLAALLAFLRTDRRAQVSGAWVVIAVALGFAAAMTRYVTTVPGVGVVANVWLGVPVLVAQGAAIVAAGYAAEGAVAAIRSGSFGWRQPLAAGVALLAVATPFAAAAWWVAIAPHGDLHRGAAVPLPAYMTQAMRGGVRVLVVSTSGSPSVYTVYDGDGLRLGDDGVLPTRSMSGATSLVTGLLSDAGPAGVRALAADGIGYLVLRAPAAPSAVAQLDGVPGLTRASSNPAVALGWHVDLPLSTGDPGGPQLSHHAWWLVGEALAWLVALTLAAPAARRGDGQAPRAGRTSDTAPGARPAGTPEPARVGAHR